jgi:hypothetical protein
MSDDFLKIYKGTYYKPRNADPANPVDGDVQFSDGTARALGLWQYYDGDWQTIGGGSLEIEKTETAHGFAQFDGIYHDGTSWLKAKADDSATLADFVVTEVINVNDFKAAKFGEVISVAHSYTVGEHYFLSDTVAGGAVIGEPSQFSNPIFYVEDVDTIHLEVYRPSVTSLASSGAADALSTTGDDVNVSLSPPPTAGQVPVATSPTTVTWQTIITPWVAYTPTYTGLGTVTLNNCFWRRVGDDMQIRGSVKSGIPTAAICGLTLPPTYTLDSTKLPISTNTTAAIGPAVGDFVESQGAAGRDGKLVTAYATSTTTIYFSNLSVSTGQHSLPANGNGITALNQTLTFNAAVPITGW